jgi:uncharacterized protein
MAPNREIIEKVNDCFIKGDTETFLTLCHDDISWTMFGYGTWKGKEELRKAMDMPGFVLPPAIKIKNVIVDGDFATVEGTIKMTKKDSGEVSNAVYCDIYQFKNGKIVEFRSYVVDLPE